MAGLNIYQPTQSLAQPTGRSAPKTNIHEGREVDIGRVQGRFSGGPQIVSGAGEGLSALAGGLGKWYAALEEREQRKQTLEAMDEISQAQDREREMFARMRELKGRDAFQAEAFAADFYKREDEALRDKARGQYQEGIYQRFVMSSRDQGLNKALAYQDGQLDQYEQSVMLGDQARFDLVANDPGSSPEDVTRAAIPYAQRQMAYMRKKGWDPRAAAHEINKNWRDGMRANVMNRLTGLAESDPAELERMAAGRPRSSRLPQDVAALADKIGAAKGVEPALLKAVIMAESAGDAAAVSAAGARGLMQLMPGTARDLGVNPDDPERNVRGGAEYISRMLEKYNGHLKHALMAYNWGPGNVDKWIQGGGRGSVPKETQNYVRKVMADYSLQKRGGQTGGGGKFVEPVAGLTEKISSAFGLREKPNARASRDHKGVDVAVPVGTPIRAMADGKVEAILDQGPGKGYGKYMLVDYGDGRKMRAAHLSEYGRGLKVGDAVAQGQVIALSGDTGNSTGPHAHIEIIDDQGRQIDPLTVFGGQEQTVRLAGSTLAGPGDVVSDARGAEETADPLTMALSAAEINPGSSGDWIFGDDAALASEFLTDEDWAALTKKSAEALDKQIKSEKEAAVSRFERLDLSGQLTMRDLESDPGFKELPYDEQLLWRKTARGQAGWMGQLRADEQAAAAAEKEDRAARKENWSNTKKDIEARFYAAMETGDIPRTREGVIRWLGETQEYFGEDLTPSDYFDRSDLNTMIAYTKGEAGRLNTAIDEYITMNPSQFSGILDSGNDSAALKLKFKKVAAERVTKLGYRLDDDRIPGLMAQLAADSNFLKGGFQLPGEYSAGSQRVRDELIRDMIKSAGAPDTGPVKRLANMAIDQGKSLGEMKAPDADKWEGRGRMTLFGAGGVYFPTRLAGRALDDAFRHTAAAAVRQHKSHFEEASKYYNIDPDFLAAVAYAASGGQRYAAGKLTPGGVGVMQIDGLAAKDLGLADGAEYDPRRNILAAAQLLDKLLDAGGGDYGAALKMYAAGMPGEAAAGFVREVGRLYHRNYGLHSGVNFKPYQLPNYEKNHGSK